MKCKIQNTGKTPVKSKYRKIPSNDTVYCALFLQIFFKSVGQETSRNSNTDASILAFISHVWKYFYMVIDVSL